MYIYAKHPFPETSILESSIYQSTSKSVQYCNKILEMLKNINIRSIFEENATWFFFFFFYRAEARVSRYNYW